MGGEHCISCALRFPPASSLPPHCPLNLKSLGGGEAPGETVAYDSLALLDSGPIGTEGLPQVKPPFFSQYCVGSFRYTRTLVHPPPQESSHQPYTLRVLASFPSTSFRHALLAGLGFQVGIR